MGLQDENQNFCMKHIRNRPIRIITQDEVDLNKVFRSWMISSLTDSLKAIIKYIKKISYAGLL